MNLQHNESAVLQSVYMVGYQSFTLYFGFELNGEEQIGTITNYDSIFVNGLEFGRGKVGNDPESFSKFCEGLDKNLPMKAEIIKKKKKCKAQIIQDGTTVTPMWTSHQMWIGDDSGLAKATEDQQQVTPQVRVNESPTHLNVPGQVISSDGPNCLLEVTDPHHELMGCKITLPRPNLHFRDGVPFRYGRSGKDIVPVDSTVYCDVVMTPDDQQELKGVFGYIGSRPSQELIDRYLKILSELAAGHVVEFIYDSSGVAIGGIIRLTVSKADNRSSFRILFDRDVAFVCGTSLARSDVSAFLADDCLRVVYDNTMELVDDGNSLVSKAKDVLGPDAEKFRFFKAKIVNLGMHIGECLVRTPDNKFDFDPSNFELQKIVDKRGMTMDELKSYLDGKKNLAMMKDLSNDKYDKASVLELIPPDKFESPTQRGHLKILSGPMAGRTAVFNRESVFIFGHNLANANLMDFVTSSDEFYIDWIHPDKSGLINIKRAWLGPNPEGPLNKPQNVEISSGLKKWWIVSHNKQITQEEFLSLVNGTSPSNRPFFSINLLDAMAVKNVAQLTNIYLPHGNGQFGVLRITSDGPCRNETVAFHSKDAYIMLKHLRHCDLHLLNLTSKDKFFVETRPMSTIEHEHWMPLFTRARQGEAMVENPTHVATIVYIGPRPRPPKSWKDVLTAEEVTACFNLSSWLNKRKISNDAFVRMVSGTASQSDYINSSGSSTFFDPQQLTGQTHPRQLQGPAPASNANPSVRALQETLNMARNLAERAMDCISPEDPRVPGLIHTPAELEIGTFLAHTLLAAVEACNNRFQPGNVSNPGTSTVNRMLQLSGSVPYQFPTPHPPRNGQFQNYSPYYSSPMRGRGSNHNPPSNFQPTSHSPSPRPRGGPARGQGQKRSNGLFTRRQDGGGPTPPKRGNFQSWNQY